MTLGPNLIYKCPNCGENMWRSSIMSGNTLGVRRYSDSKQIAPMLPEFPKIVKCSNCKMFYWLNHENTSKNEGIIENADEALFLSLEEYIEAINLKVYKNKEEEQFLRIRLWWAFNDRIRPELTEWTKDPKKRNWYTWCINDFSDDSILEIYSYPEINKCSSSGIKKMYEFNHKSKKFPATVDERKKEKHRQNMLETNDDKIIYESNCNKLLELLYKDETSGDMKRLMSAEIYRNLGKFIECKTILDTITDEKYTWLKVLLEKECEVNNKDVISLDLPDDDDIRILVY